MSQPKSKIYFGGVVILSQNMLMQETSFQIGTMPFKYLSVPLDSKKLSVANCHPLIDRMLCRINHYYTRLLSYAGHLQLVKSVLFAIVNFWLQIFPLPKKVIEHVVGMCRRFLWIGKDAVSRIAPISWEHICDPVKAGGLNVIALGTWNRATLGKILWNLSHKKDRLWINWVNHYYMKGKVTNKFNPKKTASWIMKAIFKHKEVLSNFDAW